MVEAHAQLNPEEEEHCQQCMLDGIIQPIEPNTEFFIVTADDGTSFNLCADHFATLQFG